MFQIFYSTHTKTRSVLTHRHSAPHTLETGQSSYRHNAPHTQRLGQSSHRYTAPHTQRLGQSSHRDTLFCTHQDQVKNRSVFTQKHCFTQRLLHTHKDQVSLGQEQVSLHTETLCFTHTKTRSVFIQRDCSTLTKTRPVFTQTLCSTHTKTRPVFTQTLCSTHTKTRSVFTQTLCSTHKLRTGQSPGQCSCFSYKTTTIFHLH